MNTSNEQELILIKQRVARLQTGDLSILPSIYSHFIAPQRDMATQCYAAAIAQMMRAQSGKALIDLRETFSKYTSMNWYADWRHACATTIYEAIQNPNDCFYVLALGTFHPNGYFRQHCLLQLEQFGGQALPFVLLMVNNWVEAIRNQASDIALRLLQTATTDELVQSLFFLERISLRRRRRKDIISQLNSLIRKRLEDAQGMDAAHILKLDRYTRRSCHQLLSNKLSASDQNLLLQKEPDSFNRLLVAKQILKEEPSSALWKQLLNSKSAAIRLLAVQKKYRLYGAGDWMISVLFDPYRSIRELVCFALRKNGVQDLAHYYRERLLTNPSPGAILGLGENGMLDDQVLIKPFMQDTRPAYQKAALVAIATLTASSCNDFLYAHLGYSWASKTAFELILRGKYNYSAKRCYDDFLACDDICIRHRYFRLLLRCTYWDVLPYFIYLYPMVSGVQKDTIAYHLEQRQPKFMAPTPIQKDKILKAMAHANIPANLLRLLTFSLRTCGYFPEYQ